MAKLDKGLKDILEKYGIDPTDKSKLWDCHGTLVLLHKAYEIIAAESNIKFDQPHIIEGNGKEKIASICVTGHMGDRSEWSIGEAAPGNCTNKYPYAMAEKRAKDRVIAKLVGLAQYVYSEAEADDFKNPSAGKGIYPLDKTGNKAVDGLMNDGIEAMAECKTLDELKTIYTDSYSDMHEAGCTEEQLGLLEDQKDVIKGRLSK